MQKKATKPVFPDMKLYEEIIFLGSYFDGKYCVENVASYYDPLIKPQEIGRHYYWANFKIDEYEPEYKRVHRDRTWQELEKIYDFNISQYKNLTNKRQILRNCVEPKVGKLILDCAFREPEDQLKQTKIIV